MDQAVYLPPVDAEPPAIHIKLRTIPATPRVEPTFSGVAPLPPRVVAAGDTVRTLAPGTSPSLQTPVGLTITTPVAGEVAITPTLRAPSAPTPGGYAVLGASFTIQAPTASPEQPHVFAFALDASLLEDAEGIVVPLRDGVTVPDCDDPDGTAASPDPCVASRVLDDDGDLHLEVRTSRASDWTFAATCPAVTFTDVARDEDGASDLDCLVAAGVVAGYPDGSFGRDGTLRRDQAASLLTRTLAAAGHTLPPGDAVFADVTGRPHAEAVDALAAAGVVVGTGGGHFFPMLPVLRGQFATMALGAVEATGAVTAGYPDTAGTTHGASADRLAELGIPMADEDALFEPGERMRRLEAATFLNRLMAWLAES